MAANPKPSSGSFAGGQTTARTDCAQISFTRSKPLARLKRDVGEVGSSPKRRYTA